jgi:hypothetical protein
MRTLPVMRHARTAVAVVPAPAQLGVERLQHFGRHAADRPVTDRPVTDLGALDMLAQVPELGFLDPPLHRRRRQMRVHQLRQRRVGARLPAILDLPQQVITHPLGDPPGVRPGRHDLLEVQLAPGQHVQARVHAHAQRPAG